MTEPMLETLSLPCTALVMVSTSTRLLTFSAELFSSITEALLTVLLSPVAEAETLPPASTRLLTSRALPPLMRMEAALATLPLPLVRAL